MAIAWRICSRAFRIQVMFSVLRMCRPHSRSQLAESARHVRNPQLSTWSDSLHELTRRNLEHFNTCDPFHVPINFSEFTAVFVAVA